MVRRHGSRRVRLVVAAAAWFERAAASPRAQLQGINNAAWARLFYDPTPAGARAPIQRAMGRGNDPPANVPNPQPRGSHGKKSQTSFVPKVLHTRKKGGSRS